MVQYSPLEYTFKEFQKSKTKHKKYDAILINKNTKRTVKISFGDSRYEQYKDRALGIYSHKDHLDIKRRRLYRERHKGEDKTKYSAGYFAWHYLW